MHQLFRIFSRACWRNINRVSVALLITLFMSLTAQTAMAATKTVSYIDANGNQGNDDNGGTTTIGTLDTETGEIDFGGWYTLSGRKLDTKPTQKGLYIHNGGKVVIK